MNNKYTTVGLYDHNADGYDLVKEAFTLEDIVAILRATGTGKTFIALQLAYDNPNKKIVYVVPSNGIIEHINQIIEDNPNLDLERDFPNLELRTYQSFISLSEEEIADIDCDLLILDEFHHIGAPVWGARIHKLIETHPEIQVLGMSAYSVRDRGTSYERDMADPDGDELFSGKVVSRYDLCDAMIDGILPKPVYKSAYTNLIGLESQLEEKLKKLEASTKEYQEYMAILNSVKKRIQEAPSIPNILKKSLKPDGKYIYFCPPCSEEGTNDIETIKKQAIEWFKEFVSEEDIVIYTSTSEMGEEGRKNRNAFYNDTTLDGESADGKFRIMFAINQYNEGVHAPNIDGVIMGRGTTSDIVYFEQLGRGLSVRGNTKEKFDELEKYSIDKLIHMCREKDIPVRENSSKEELIEKLIAPVIIDLTNNYEFIKELENNLGNRIKEIQEKGLGHHREIKIRDASFDIEIENQDLFEMLQYVMNRLIMTWEDKYNLAKSYYEHYGNLEIPRHFKTINGIDYDENGFKLGIWIVNQRQAYKGQGNNKITKEQIELLNKIEMRWDNIDIMDQWMETYELAKAYYEHYGNLEIPFNFKTINGIEFDENGVNLGNWIANQRRAYKRQGTNKITKEQIELLNEIGMRWDSIDVMEQWMKKYNLAKAYYEHYGNLEIPVNFKTVNGIEFDENGINLGRWIANQRKAYKGQGTNKITKEHIELLNKIEMRWDSIDIMEQWMKKYNLVKAYYEHYGNLEIPVNFKTINGIEYDENGVNLGRWIAHQRGAHKGQSNRKITKEQIELLEQIGMIWNSYDNSWTQKYNLAKSYYEHYGNLEIPQHFKTINGIEYDENGVNLGQWITNQRRAYKGQGINKITEEQIKLLEDIGMNWFSDNINNKLQEEEIISKNVDKKRKEIQNRFYSVLNQYDDDILPPNEELNDVFLEQLNLSRKR